ncbi:PREDICTED: uncharacterized protein LOC107340691 [Acropora digitifera]|uniref:uncharacterized protein LOC107340691 n=1 Tax=Acropora digitifera TaxID=70779 RepID=UPI00077B0152|nr:PREDICTED: uncharacterized protein LOC107340691 [Acropora digitifera]
MAALNKAIFERRFKQARDLIDKGVNVNSRCQDGNTALIQLCFVEQEALAIATATRLLKRGAKIDASNNHGLSALSTAVLTQREKLVSLLLKEAGNFNLNSRDNKGNTALFHAAHIGNFSILTLLVTALKRFHLSLDEANNDGTTPLMQACLRGNVNCAKYLITEGRASLTIRDNNYKKTAMEWAENKGVAHKIKIPLFYSFIDNNKRHEDGTQRTDYGNKIGTAVGQTGKSCKLQLREIYYEYECQLTKSFKPGRIPEPKPTSTFLPPILNKKGSNTKGTQCKNRHLSKHKGLSGLPLNSSFSSVIRPPDHLPPKLMLKRSQSIADLMQKIKDLERLPYDSRSRPRSAHSRESQPVLSRLTSPSKIGS